MGNTNMLPVQTPPDDLEFKSATAQTGVEVLDDEKGIVNAFVSVTGMVDRVNDNIIPGAYTKTLMSRKPKGIMNHDWNKLVSKVLDVKELMPGDPDLPKTLPNGDAWPIKAGALLVKAQYNLNTQDGRDAYENAKFLGPEQEWSIGYNVPAGDATKSDQGIREIKSLELYEFSQVLWGAMPVARTQSIKSGKAKSKDEDPDMDMDDDNDPADMTDPLDMDDDDTDANVPDKKKKAGMGMKPGMKSYDALVTSWKALSSVLFEEGIITEDLATKIDGVGLETKDATDLLEEAPDYESFDDAVDDVLGDVLESDDLDQLKSMATVFDMALKSGDEMSVTSSEGSIVDFLVKSIEGFGSDTDSVDAVRELALVMHDMVTDEGKALFTKKPKMAPAKGDSMPDGSMTITSWSDIKPAIAKMNAMKAGPDKDAAMAHIKKRGMALKAPDAMMAGMKSDDVMVVERKAFDLSDLKAALK